MNPDQLITTTLLTDIVFQILLKLPFESLLRCKSVCKEWYSLISSDHHFIKSHYTLSSTNINCEHHRLIYRIYKQDNDLISCPLYDVLFDGSVNNTLLLENPFQQTRGFQIIGSCNGLICIKGMDDSALFIYNPCTRTTNILPRPNLGGFSGYVFYGFGYDETTHDYKVVKIRSCDRITDDLGTMIYSLKAGSWKEIGRFPCLDPRNYGKFFNGALHWVTGDHPSSRDIVSLDLGKETYGEVLQPEYDRKGDKILNLGVLGGWLCVLCNYYESRVMDVWVMKVYGVKDSWTKLLSISNMNDLFSIPSYVKFHTPLCMSNDGKLLLRFGTKLVVYDCTDSSYSEIQNLHVSSDACIVVESLVSPFAPLGLGDNNGDEN